MAKPNRVFANLPKRPFDPVQQFRKETDAEELANKLKEEGFDTKITRMKLGPKKKPIFMYNVWKRPKE
jgi:hypothetical protein